MTITGTKQRFDPRRLLAMGAVVALLFVLLVVRLARLQLVQAEAYLRQSETNRVRAIEIPPLRGLMLDRNGRILVDNYPSYTLLAVPAEIEANPAVVDTLLALTGLDSTEFLHRLHRIPGNRYTPVRILRDLPYPLLAALEERRARLPGILFSVEPKRAYPNPVAPHTLGHIGELKEEQQAKYPGLRTGDMVGQSGLEEQWNRELVGTKGVRYLEVDALGRQIGPLRGAPPVPPVPGSDLVLTIDLDLQKRAEALLGDWAGAIVAIEPATGEVLVIASKPDYPPETFSGVLSPEEWRRLRDDPSTPLVHRAVQGVYPPGSVFKMAILAAGLQSGVIDANWTVTCAGGYQLGRRWFNCWNKAGHGKVNHVGAIEASCDVYFYLLGLKLGIDRFHEEIARFGFGRKTGIDLPSESAGLLPDRGYFDRRYGKGRWSEGHLFNVAIGQGDVLITPLQAANYAAILANGGWWKTPHLVRRIRRPDGREIEPGGVRRHETGIDEQVFDLVRRDMLLVTEGPYGTAAWLYDPRMHVAGKTGTAQNPHGEDHALFVAFAPFDDPQIAVAVIIENGEHGSTAAAPIAFKLIRQRLGLDDATWFRYRAQILAARAAADSTGGGPVE